MFRFTYSLIVFFLFILVSCSRVGDSERTNSASLFKLLYSDQTGINFRNELSSIENFDVFRYRNFYNGGGVGIGDINNDGLADVFFTSNMGENKLYLNKGNWK